MLERVASWPEFHPGALLAALVSRGVDFVVIGGYAAVAHGSGNITRDVDVCFAPDESNLRALGDALIDLEARLASVTEDVPFTPDAATLRRTDALTLMTRAGRLDVLRVPDGAPRYETLRRRALRVQVEGVAVLVASLEDLISMKRAADRPKDRIALEELEVIDRLRRSQTDRR